MKRLILLVFLVLTSCQENKTEIVEFKKGELTDASKELLEIYCNDSMLDSLKYDIDFIKRGIDTLEILAVVREEFFGDKTHLNYYVDYFKGFRVFIWMNKDDRFFYSSGKTLKKDVYIDIADINKEKDIPLTYDTPYWIMILKENRISHFECQFCTPIKELLDEIKAIEFPRYHTKSKIQRS
ncbi:hypothetical protein [Namhaeicola litoreus]|uniref:DUF4348 domain-containing protein n=1 Tax=Namhaeicola litoreus TaxID=1052145 RepID=A0ABW3Y4R7_9FLAO